MQHTRTQHRQDRAILGLTMAFTVRTYVHAQNDALKTVAASLQRVVTPS
jgi:hypothetical protein